MGRIAKKIQLASSVDDNWNGFLARKRPYYLQASTAGENKPEKNSEQDGRLAPAYFSPEYINFDQDLQTVKNETTV